MSSQADSIVTATQQSPAKCERCRRDRRKCVKGVVGMTGCKECAYLGHECSQSADVPAQPSDLPIIVRKEAIVISIPAELPKQNGELVSSFRKASVESISSEDEKDMLRNKTENCVIEPVVKSGIVPGADTAPTNKILQQFEEFAKQERERLSTKKRAQATHERTKKIQDLKRFSQNFHLTSPIPSDLVSILAKDPDKQQAIVDKAKRDHEEGKTNTVDSPQVASDAGLTSIETPIKPSLPPPSRRSAGIVIKNSAGEDIDFTKRFSSTPVADAACLTDNVGTPSIEVQPDGLATAVDAGQPGASSFKKPTTDLPARPESSISHLYVRGIDGKVTGDVLRQVFETVGRTRRVQIFRDPDPHLKGHAFIEYDDPAAAARAKALLDGRRVHDTEMHIALVADSVAETRYSGLLGGSATHTPSSRPMPASPSPVLGDRAYTLNSSRHSGTLNTSPYIPERYPFDNTPYRPWSPQFDYDLIARVLNGLFTINSLTTNQLLRRNIDFDGYIPISVLMQYKINGRCSAIPAVRFRRPDQVPILPDQQKICLGFPFASQYTYLCNLSRR